jgi:hypothetical protein
MITRVNTNTGREEYWNQPEGLPGNWMERGFCQRCKTFNKCMGLLDLTDAEWKSVEDLIRETNDLLKIENEPSLSNLKKCTI